MLRVASVAVLLATALAYAADYPHENGAFHVYPPAEIQPALDLAGAHPTDKHVVVHAGIYRPQRAAQALIWLNQRHDGVLLEAAGAVQLTAANPEIADRSAESFPAVVNHVVYIGDGVSRGTVVRGLEITGANNYVTDLGGGEAIEPHFAELRKTEGFYGRLFFFTDGGAIKIFGRSYPTLENLRIHDNFSRPCAGGISIEHRGFTNSAVLLKNCVFEGNRAAVTGSGVDLLPGSTAEIQNCLFVRNLSNREKSYVKVKGNIDWPEIPKLLATTFSYQPQHGSGALTVFPRSSVQVDHCTFTGNFNGVDDNGGHSSYLNCIFWQNSAPGDTRPPGRYELNVAPGTIVSNCFIHGEVPDLRRTVSQESNRFDSPDPEFNSKFSAQNSSLRHTGYIP